METVGRNWDAKAEECILSIFSCRERFCLSITVFYYIHERYLYLVSQTYHENYSNQL